MANRRASITDLAKQLNLSPSTISRALADHEDVSEATKTRVRELAAALNYQPNQLAAGLRRGRSKMLGVLVPHIIGNFFPQVVHGIATEANLSGFNVMIFQSNEDEAQERKNIELLLNAQVEGILVSVSKSTKSFGHFETLRNNTVPLVFFDRSIEGIEGKSVGAVVLDDYQGAYEVVEHLVAQGCTRIAHFTGGLHLNIHRNRHRGYLDALRAHGLPTDEELTVLCEMSLEGGIQGMQKLLALPQPPDAVFSSIDVAAVGALQVLKQAHIRVPQDVALVGFSNEQFTSFTDPSITSVDQHCELMGRTAVRLLLELIADDPEQPPVQHNVVLKPKLLIRESSLRQPDGSVS